jgi:hypothetical protein
VNDNPGGGCVGCFIWLFAIGIAISALGAIGTALGFNG